MRAMLTGTASEPEVVLWVRSGDKLSDGRSAVSWVKRATNAWVLPRDRYRPQRLPARFVTKLESAGFEIEVDESLGEIGDGSSLVDPMVFRDNAYPGQLRVRPRLAGFEATQKLLGPGVQWDKATRSFIADPSQLVSRGQIKEGFLISEDTAEMVLSAVAVEEMSYDQNRYASYLAVHDGTDEKSARAIGLLEPMVGSLPQWFGLDLYDYQRAGAYAAAAGHTAIVDEPGLGKTRQSLASAAICRSNRTLVVCPPVVLTHWARESAQAGLTRFFTDPQTGEQVQADTDQVAVISPTRKVPELPDRGVVVVADSTISARTELLMMLRQWQADVLIYDEAHRGKTWGSLRAMAMRSLSTSATRTFTLTGTPLSFAPVELASMLSMTGHLNRVFGGFDDFCQEYARQDKYRRWLPRANKLQQLTQMLDTHVWVRRVKTEVLTSLPPIRRSAEILNVPLGQYRRQHKEVKDSIVVWIDEYRSEHGNWPDERAVAEYCRSNVGMFSPLRKAAGMSKIDAAVERVAEWVEATWDAKAEHTDRPLLVWVHHRDVFDALIEATPDHLMDKIGMIRGGTSQTEMARVVDEFQAGRVPVAYLGITAAGVGITLTHGSDQLFVEVDPRVEIVRQAEDRQWRIGQENTVEITTLIAADTQDIHSQAVLAKKSAVIDQVLPRGSNTADCLEQLHAAGQTTVGLGDLQEMLVNDVLYSYSKGKAGHRMEAAQ